MVIGLGAILIGNKLCDDLINGAVAKSFAGLPQKKLNLIDAYLGYLGTAAFAAGLVAVILSFWNAIFPENN